MASASIKKRKKRDGCFITIQVPCETKAEIREIYKAKGWLKEGEFMRSVIRQVIVQYREEKQKPG